MPQTLEEIRQQGFEALRERLGRAGMIRFVQQFSNGEGDYAKARHTWVDELSLEDLRSLPSAGKPTRKRRKKKQQS